MSRDLLRGSWNSSPARGQTTSTQRPVAGCCTSEAQRARFLILSLILTWLITRDIESSFRGLRHAMARLSEGDLGTEIDGLTRTDEIGEMARATLKFRDRAIALQEREALAANEKMNVERDAREVR